MLFVVMVLTALVVWSLKGILFGIPQLVVLDCRGIIVHRCRCGASALSCLSAGREP